MAWLLQIGKESTIIFVFLLLTACSRPTSPMKITTTISPEPVVGQDANLRVEITTKGVRAPNTTVTI